MYVTSQQPPTKKKENVALKEEDETENGTVMPCVFRSVLSLF